VYVISVAAQLVELHPQTLRSWEARGLVSPQRTEGRARRYSEADLDRVRRIIELTGEGVSLPAVARILELEDRLAESRAEVKALKAQLPKSARQTQRR
jgi:MerR family transcriptional regulator/heat shock protein HspR